MTQVYFSHGISKNNRIRIPSVFGTRNFMAKAVITVMSANKIKTMLEYYTVLQHNRTFSGKKHGHCRTHPQLNSPWDHVEIFETVFHAHGGGSALDIRRAQKEDWF